MNTKSALTVLLLLLACSFTLKSQTQGNAVTNVILSGYTARTFSSQAVADTDINLILQCGIKAPSARNLQPWKFTVVRDEGLVKKILPSATPGNILIVVSGSEDEQAGMYVDFDCALATQNMYIAAQSLGLGAHIYMSPVSNVNTNLKNELGISEGYRVVTILQIGSVDKSVDAVSSASARNPLEEVVNYK